MASSSCGEIRNVSARGFEPKNKQAAGLVPFLNRFAPPKIKIPTLLDGIYRLFPE